MRRKMLPARHKAALHWITRAVILTIVLVWLGPWNLTPAAANQQELEPLLTEPVVLVCQTAGPEDNQLVLSWNDHFVCLGAYYPYRFLEWNCRSREIAQREEGRPFTAGANEVHLAEGDDAWETRWNSNHYIFGRVEDPAVKTVVIDFKGSDGDGPSDGSDFRKTITLTVENLERYEGTAWFIRAVETDTSIVSRACSVTAYDIDGNSLGTFQVIGVPRWE